MFLFRQDFEEVKQETGRSGQFLSVECTIGLYTSLLFTKGYGFPNNTRQITAKENINGEPVGRWTWEGASWAIFWKIRCSFETGGPISEVKDNAPD